MLLRIAVLVGLVVCGWLLGTATGSAEEAGAGEAGPRHDWAHVALTHEEGGEPAETPSQGATGSLLTPLVETSADELLPVGEVLRLPVQPMTPDLAMKIVEPLVAPVADHVLGAGPPERINQSPPSRLTAAVDQPARPLAEPAPARTLPGPAIPLPQVLGPAVAAPTALSTAEDPAADVRTESSAAVDQRSTPLNPASPPATTGTSCPAGPTGPATAAPGAHSATLDDGVAKADVALAARWLNTGAGGLPRCPSQQPSTSPD
ncbi:MAG: hypothetical protein ACRDTE_01500 [Pseudonocardiaceae bacterium]